MRLKATESHRARATALMAALFMFLLVIPSWPTGSGTANFGAGPYTLNMYFEELPKPWFGGDWWNSNWTIRQKLSFDTQSINEDLPDFPVLIALNSSRIDYANTQNAGEDIRFVDADGITALDHEIERWNESGTSLVWVKVPLIDQMSTTDHIWMYYGNQAVLDGQNSSGVWDPNYLMVQHLNETNRTTGGYNDHLDSTSSGNNLEAVLNDINMSVPGMIGGADNFDGNNDYLDSDGDEMDACEFQGAVELWVKLDNTTSTLSIFSTEENRDRAIWTEAGQFRAGMNTGVFTSRIIGGGAVDNDWHHIVFSWDILSGNLFLYLDGALVDTDQGSSWSTSGRFIPTRYGHFEVLSLSFPIRDYFDGMMDEIRVLSVVPSADWNAAQYRSMTDTFVAFGEVQMQFQYRRAITITSGSSDLPPGYTVSVDLDHASLVAAGKSQADGDDIRIIYWDSTDWVEIDRILDPASSWNDNSTRAWFPLYRGIEASTSDKGYHVYYGNANVSSPPVNAVIGTLVKSVQSGTGVNAANGITTISITQVDMSKAFLIFNTRHNGNRPVSSELAGRIATPTSLEFRRSTNETSPIAIQWYVVEYYSGVRVQRGQIPSQNSTMLNVPINQIASVQQAFVTWSKTPNSADVNWSSDDPVLGELTNTTNLQFRVQGANFGHTIWWQVVEFTDPARINVQKGSIFTMTGSTTSANATLSVPVDVNKTFVLVGFRMAGGGPMVGANMLRAQLVNSTTVMIDRCLSGPPNDITEINWQVVELRDGSKVFAGSENIRSGRNQDIVSLPEPVDVNRSVAFASVQPASGQNMGRSPYAGDDITGVGSVTMALSATDITMERDNTADEADIGWFVVEFEREAPAIVLGPEHSTGDVQITASTYHVRPDGTNPQEIVTSPITTIDSRTPNPFALNMGSGPQLNFTDVDPRLLRLEINVVNIYGGERFGLAYGTISQPTNLETPANSSNIFYLHDYDTLGVIPAGKWMNGTTGTDTERVIFDTPGQSAYWYHMLWSPPSVNITSPAQDQHVTGVVDVLYAMNPPVVSVLFEYHNGVTWTSLGYDLDMDGVFQWNSCSVGDGLVTLRATAADPLGYTGEDTVTGIEIDCTPPSIQILQPTDHSIIQGNVSISYLTDADAVRVVLRYDDGIPHTITTETPPDGAAIWNVTGQTHSGTILRAIAIDEVGLTSQTEVVGLSTPEPIIPTNIPPVISGVPDIIVHYDYSYNFDLMPYISDEDNSTDELTVTTSDIVHIWESPANNLGIVMNYPQSMLGQTVRVTIWVTDQIDTAYQVINVTISDDYPPEKLRLLPDVSFNEDETKLNAFYTNLDYYFLDVDGDNLYYSSGNESVRIRINPNNTVDMWALPDWFGYEIITIRATDPTGALVEDVVIIQVNPVNDAPVIEEIPEIHLYGNEIRTVDLSDYIYDIDSPTESLSITVDSEYATTSGLNLTLQFPNGIREEYLQITVSDGEDSTVGMVKVVVHLGQDDCLFLWIIMLAALMNVLVWALYIVNRPRIYAGFLLRENGSLIKEMSVTRKQTVPYGLIRERIKAKGIEQKDRLDLDRYRVSLVQGERLQLAVVSTPHISKYVIAKMRGHIQSLDTDQFDQILADEDEEKIDEHLADFETTFRRISKST